MNMKSLPLSFLAALAILTGTITDKTTGQPLVGVTVTATHAGVQLSAKTNSQGQFVFKRIADGDYALHLSSRDVPPQTMQVKVAGKATHVSLQACSTTLDYRCGSPNMPGGG
jgi:hypothetical protein